MTRAIVFSLALISLVPSAGSAQPDRYDTGKRLVAFERAWDAQPDPVARKRTLPYLKQAMATFFSGRLSDAGRLLDSARHALASAEPLPPELADAFSLNVRPASRLVDPADKTLSIQITRHYKPADTAAEPLTLHVQVIANGKTLPEVRRTIKLVPESFELPIAEWPEGDHAVRWQVLRGDRVLTEGEFLVSSVAKCGDRLAKLREAIEQLPDEGQSTETRTLRLLGNTLSKLAQGSTFETDYPAARLVAQAEQLAKVPAGTPFFEGRGAGQHWLCLDTARKPAIVRLNLPEIPEGKKVPLVVALHGAGGSENMFFDAYGHGAVVREAARRGWIVVATRTEFFGSPPVDAVVDELARRYPIDTARVFLVGHSMGAGQAMALAQQFPDRWAGVAALGGGGRAGKPDAFKQVPLFVGVGTEDFAIGGARALVKSVQPVGGTLVVKEYPDIEHIVIVQVALPEVFAWFEKLPAR